VLVEEVSIRLKELIYHIAQALKVAIIEVETDKDHVHILAEVDPQFGVNQFVRRLKGKTSRILRDEFPHLRKRLPTLWTNSYFVATVGGAPLEVIKQYIENQQLSESEKSKQRWKTFLENGQE
jgi:putative transposase